MKDFSFVNKAIQVCVANAEAHIAAARELRRGGHNNMGFNAAVLALEEIGKAHLIGMSHGPASDKEADYVRESWFDDHVKKLFWALWGTTFGRRADTLRDFQDFPHIANRIHVRRLNAIYIDPEVAELPVHIPDDEIDQMIGLAEYAIGTEKQTHLAEVDDKDRADLEWFLRTGDDPRLGSVIFGKDSFARLRSLRGSVREWVKWLRAEVDRLEEYNRRLADEEMNRVLAGGDDTLNPKWRLKVRLFSQSHSIRGKSLSYWNKRSRFIKLSAARDRKDLIVEFLVPRTVHFRDLWAAGSTAANLLAVALNVATRGFFWWYLPAETAAFFDEIRDLERNEPLQIGSPVLNVGWGSHVLGENELEETLRVHTYLCRLSAGQGGPYMVYRDGLALVAKNDIHGRFEPTILRLFYEAFRACAVQGGHWDGSSSFTDAAEKGLGIFRDRIDSIRAELPRLVHVGDTLLQGGQVPDLTLKDAIMMKLFCDLYISRVAHEALGFQLAREEEKKAANAAGGGGGMC